MTFKKFRVGMSALFFLFIFLADISPIQAQSIEQVVVVTSHNLTNQFIIQQKIEEVRKNRFLKPKPSANYKDLLLKSMQIGYNDDEIKMLLELGNKVSQQGDYEQATSIFLIAIRYCNTIRQNENLSSLYSNLGNAYNNQSKFKEAYQAYSQAAELATHSPALRTAIYNNISTVLGQLKEYDKALFYIDKALPYAIQSTSYELWSVLLMNKGRVYYEMKDYEKSAHYIDSAILISRTQKIFPKLASALIESGRVEIAKGEIQKSLPKLLEALELSEKIGMPVQKRNEAISTIGNAYLQLKKYKQAENYLLLALEISDQQPREQLFIKKQLATLYSAVGNHEKAYFFHKSFTQMQDSLQSKEVAVSVNDLETRYRTLEKDKEITQNRLEISNQQKRIAEKNSWLTAIIAFAIVAFTLLLWRYFYVRQKSRKLHSLQEIKYLKGVMEGEEKERVRIANELHDGIVSELTSVKMNLQLIKHHELDQQQNYLQTLNQLDVTINEVRNTAHNLMPEILLRHHLAQAVELLCITIQKTGSLDIDFQQYGDFTQLNMKLRHAAYRIIQELLHNILKHARASNALVQLSCYDNLLAITIEDNGLGIDWTKKKQNKGMGLRSIEQRVKNLNGTIEWNHSASRNNTNVYIEFEV